MHWFIRCNNSKTSIRQIHWFALKLYLSRRTFCVRHSLAGIRIRRNNYVSHQARPILPLVAVRERSLICAGKSRLPTSHRKRTLESLLARCLLEPRRFLSRGRACCRRANQRRSAGVEARHGKLPQAFCKPLWLLRPTAELRGRRREVRFIRGTRTGFLPRASHVTRVGSMFAAEFTGTATVTPPKQCGKWAWNSVYAAPST